MSAKQSAPTAAPVPVTVAHDRIAGRTRLAVPGLKRDPGYGRHLEARLAGLAGIVGVSASPWSGRVLIVHDPEIGTADIVAMAGRACRRGAGRGPASRHVAVPTATPSQPCHVLPLATVLARSGSGRDGLSSAEAARRLAADGANAIAVPPPPGMLATLLDQFRGAPAVLLLAAAGLSLATGGLLDAALIGGVIGVNAGIGFVTERRTDAIIRGLSQVLRPHALVLRDGEERRYPAEAVVRGDVLCLSPGEVVAADARLIEADHLLIDEALLTGESLPADKNAKALASDLPLADRANMAYRGTVVVGGSGRAVVVATGPATEVAAIQRLTSEAETPETPMQRQLRHLGNQLVVASGLSCLAFLGIGLLRGWGGGAVLRGAISLGVAAVPEGLPTAATTVMALGVRRMGEENVLIRRLDAVETLGAVTAICFDKTGTLTHNRMTVVTVAGVREDWSMVEGRLVDGEDRDPLAVAEVRRLLEVGVLCNDAGIETGSPSGSPTEAALLSVAHQCGLGVTDLRRRWPRLATHARSDRRRFMLTLHRGPGGAVLAAVKGSPADVLTRCSRCLAGGKERRLDDATRAAIVQRNAAMGQEGQRVLGLAYGTAPPQRKGGVPEDLVWLGLVGMADPPRAGMRALMRQLHQAGIATAMITGDQSATALAVARRLGLGANGGEIGVLDATILERADPAALVDLVGRAQVFARVTPAHKLRIVRALQAGGQVVAMTGDGVNDSPALRAADIGLAMQGGSDVARAAADVVLADDSLRTMLAGVRLGRAIRDNVRKAIRYLVATNLSEIEVMLAAALGGLGQPLTPAQLLWINLVSDVLPALALALEPPAPDVLTRGPHRADAPALDGRTLRRLATDGTVMAGGAFCAYFYGIARHGMGGPASGMAFLSLVSSQLLYAATCRSERPLWSAPDLPPNPALRRALGGSLALQGLALTVPPLRRLLGLEGLGWSDLLASLAGALLPPLIIEARKDGGAPAGRSPADHSAAWCSR